MPDILVITACDDNHHALASDLIQSLNDVRDGSFSTAFVNIDDGPLCRSLKSSVDQYHAMFSALGPVPFQGLKIGAMKLKTNLPALFPGFATYVWLDADTWVQNARGIANAARGAEKADIAIHPELDPNYFRLTYPSERTVTAYRSIFPGQEDTLRFPMVNSGVFAARADSKLWHLWEMILEPLRERRAQGEDVFLSDQIPLHRLIFGGRLTLYPLRAADNWQLYAAMPAIDPVKRKLVAPSEPHEEINILHLAGKTKDVSYDFGQTGKKFTFRYSDIKRFFAGSP